MIFLPLPCTQPQFHAVIILQVLFSIDVPITVLRLGIIYSLKKNSDGGEVIVKMLFNSIMVIAI